MDDMTMRHWREGADAIEACLAKAERAAHADAPFPLDEAQAKLWHRAQADAYRHALEMMAPEDHAPPARGGGADGGPLGPFGNPGPGKGVAIATVPAPAGGGTALRVPVTPDMPPPVPNAAQAEVVQRILSGYRTIVAGVPGSGRSTAAALATMAWDDADPDGDGRPALLVLRDARTLATAPTTSLVRNVIGHAEITEFPDPAGYLKGFGLVVVDDADDGQGLAKAADIVVRMANTSRVARFVTSGRNDDDATLAMRERIRQAS